MLNRTDESGQTNPDTWRGDSGAVAAGGRGHAVGRRLALTETVYLKPLKLPKHRKTVALEFS